ncbi:Lrp/AsnC family transcriptional regulator [archaeon]|nr:Lrp/AsnC family transcriptional regulator [archaeon]
MDETDEKIIETLKKNSRTSYKEIARHAHISDVAVHKRIKKLEGGVLKGFTVLVDQKAYEKNTVAIANVRCETGMTFEIAEALAKIEDVTEVYTTVGNFDIAAKIRTRDTDSLKEIIETKIRAIRGINEIRTSIVFDCVKEDVNLVF